MKQKSLITILLTVFMSMIGIKALAYDIEVKNTDGVTIYYNYSSDGKELIVTSDGYHYSGSIVIPEEVTYMNRTRKVTSIGDGAFYYSDALTSVTIPNSVTSIGNEAFLRCSALTSVIIPNSVKSIGKYAFYDCSALTSVTIGNSVTSIGDYAFYYCSALTSVTIPNSVTSIGLCAFSNCSNLPFVTIPNSVTSIGLCAFEGVNSTIVISLIENPFSIIGKSSGDRTFSQNIFNNATLYVPKGTIEKYKAAEGWKDFFFIEEIIGHDGGGETPGIQKCATPTISCQNGKFSFSCATPDVEFHWSITNANGENGSGYGVSTEVSPSFKVCVYATKTGFVNSDTETRQFDCNTGGLKGDVDGDGKVNVADHVELSKIILNQ